MRRLYVIRPLALVLIAVLTGLAGSPAVAQAQAAPAQSSASKAPSREFVDGIAAVVNQNVITLQQLNVETRNAQARLKRENIPQPDHETLQKQVLQRMIAQELERQEAERLDIHVTDDDIQAALASIAQRNNISVEQLRKEVLASGTSWDAYMKELRQDVRLDMLRRRTVDSAVFISDADVDAFLRSEGRQLSLQPAAQSPGAGSAGMAPSSQAARPQVLGLAHILVAVPEGANSAQVAELRRKAESLLAQVRGGKDFAGVAAASSDGPQALEGGDLGERPLEGWPDLFLEATEGLGAGDITDVFQSGNGFHILKIVSAGGAGPGVAAPAPSPRPTAPAAGQGDAAMQAPGGSTMVTQTHARHILIRTSQVMSDDQARNRLVLLRERVSHGEQFEDLAKRYSEDPSAPQGGDLGWLTPGDTVPAFEQAMDALEPGQVSAPVHSQFGWHLIQVVERRSKDMGDEFKRMQARQILFQRRVEPALEDWLSQLRGRAYIENRLDPDAGSRPRR